jgi:hypothetical protein
MGSSDKRAEAVALPVRHYGYRVTELARFSGRGRAREPDVAAACNEDRERELILI